MCFRTKKKNNNENEPIIYIYCNYCSKHITILMNIYCAYDKKFCSISCRQDFINSHL
jgi:hypothetical protein